MKGVAVRLAAITSGMYLVSYMLSGIEIEGLAPALVSAVILLVLNAFIRPAVLFLTFPVNLLTLGLFSVALNGVFLWFAGAVVDGLEVTGYLSAVTGAFLISLLTVISREILD